jgi:glycosyltransferase involved in cell wall biosynthesis
MPTISVIIPAYNAEHTILETISSVQKQTFSDFELIVVDDGSTDRMLELLHSVKDERLKIFSYENAGVSVSRNRGLSHATGEFIAFIDADDLWTPDKLELQLAALQVHPEAGVAYSWTHFIDEKGESFHAEEPKFFEGNVYAPLLLNNFLNNGSNPLIRKQAIESVGEFNPVFSPSADWDFYLRLAARWHFVVVPKLQILYRQSSGSMSSKVDNLKQESLNILEQAFNVAPQEIQYLKNQSYANVYTYCAELFLRKNTNVNDVEQAGKNLLLAIRRYPRILLNIKTIKLVKWYIKKYLQLK